MGVMSIIKGNRAFALQKKGQKDEAIRLYEEAIAEGLNDPRYLMPYALLIIRDGQYQKAKDFLVAHQRVPGMSPQQRTELLVYYAVCCLRLGCVDKGINALEQQAQKGENGLIYPHLHLRREGRYPAGQDLREGLRLVRQRVGLQQQGLRNG